MIALDLLLKSPKDLQLKSADSGSEQGGFLSFEALLKNLAHTSDAKNDSEIGQLSKLLKNSEDSVLKLPDSITSKESETPSKNPQAELLELLRSAPQEIDDHVEKEEPISLNGAFSKNLSLNELKYLVHKAKQYLKQQILSLHPQTIKENELPKTLKGLLQVAQKLKIEVKSITFETISKTKKVTTSITSQERIDIEMDKQPKVSKTTRTLDVQEEVVPKQEEKRNIAPKNGIVEQNPHDTLEAKMEARGERWKTTPLFASKQEPFLTKSVPAKEIMDSKRKQSRANAPLNPLESLLQKKEPLTQEVSVANRNVAEELFTKGKNEAALQTAVKLERFEDGVKKREKNDVEILKELLGNNQEEKTSLDVKVKSAESFDVKIQEAKQMVRYLSNDIKRAIDEYKPPFSRMKVKLNPQKLGELDLTVVQRGKNVHINLSSNNAAINLLSNNLGELKTQLSQNGINNASFAFNGSFGGDQNQKEKEHSKKQYEYFASEEENEEMQQALEIIIPRYI